MSLPVILNDFMRSLRVADQLCTGHAVLRDECLRRQRAFDSVGLLISTWLVAMVFVSPEISTSLTPPFFTPVIWVGGLSVAVFFFNCMQFLTDWKRRAQAHQHAVSSLSAYVKGYRGKALNLTEAEASEALCQYSLITEALIEIPERDFLRLKRKHLVKVEISRYLSRSPGASIFMLYLRIWWRDNVCFAANRESADE